MIPNPTPVALASSGTWDCHHLRSAAPVPVGSLSPLTSTIGLVKSQTGSSLLTGGSSPVEVAPPDSATWMVTHPSWCRSAPLGQTWDW